jgi:hypothetical protein
VRLETPLGWHPLISTWAPRSAHVRWETLTGTPLDVNWLWEPCQDSTPTPAVQRRLDEAWKKESAAAEQTARTAGVAFRWTGEPRSPRAFANLEAEGQAREYVWDGQPGALAVLCLAARGRRAYVSVACCPPASCPEPAGTLKRLLHSLAVAGADDPFRVSVSGLNVELAPEFRLEGVRGREGHAYLDVEAPGRRLVLARLGFAEWHLTGNRPEKVWAALAKVLFDRSEPGDPIGTVVGGQAGPGAFGTRAQPRDPESSAAAIREHAGVLFLEKHRFHVRFGDWVVRKLLRPWAGGAAVLAWHCPETHSLWGLSARCGAADPAELVRTMAAQVVCHGPVHSGSVDWASYTAAEAEGPSAAPPGEAAPKAKPNPAALRRRQLRFRVRALPEVRLEPSSRDATGDLVYQASAPDGFLARVLRGGAAPALGYRRLALDPIGRRTWEALSRGPRVGAVLAELSREFAAHPVEMFPKLLGFLKTLGERRLVEGVGEATTPEGARAR